jgi:RNA ligase (TIGR02306 family)
MMQRKLVTVRVIDNIEPIDNADMIEIATTGGWKVVVKKDQFRVGDWVLYFEIDSFLPIKEEYEFLRKSSYKKMGDLEGFRLKTIKLKGVTSQGLITPIPKDLVYFDVGDDVTESLGVIKYEAPIPACLVGKIKGNFPTFIPKTDEERIQNLAGVYENFRKSQFYVTEKLDGSSATFYLNNGEFGVCSRNIDLLETSDNSFWKIARELQLEEKLRSANKNLAIQGELIGEGIQGNPYRIKGQKIKFFNVFDIDNQLYYGMYNMIGLINDLELETVPILEHSFYLPETVEELLKFSEGKSELNCNIEREGLVLRNIQRTTSFKVISNKFLLKNE